MPESWPICCGLGFSPVYHGEHGLRTLRELARSYLAVTRDLTRVMNRLKALYRSWAIPCAGQQVYALRYRSEWLSNCCGDRCLVNVQPNVLGVIHEGAPSCSC
jgi:hypothetical protein